MYYAITKALYNIEVDLNEDNTSSMEIPDWDLDIQIAYPVRVIDGQYIIKVAIEWWVPVQFINGKTKYKMTGECTFTINSEEAMANYSDKAVVQIREVLIREVMNGILRALAVSQQQPQPPSIPEQIDVYNLASKLPYSNMQ